MAPGLLVVIQGLVGSDSRRGQRNHQIPIHRSPYRLGTEDSRWATDLSPHPRGPFGPTKSRPPRQTLRPDVLGSLSPSSVPFRPALGAPSPLRIRWILLNRFRASHPLTLALSLFPTNQIMSWTAVRVNHFLLFLFGRTVPCPTSPRTARRR